MAFIDKNKRFVANKTQPVKIFNTEAEYVAFRDSLTDPSSEIADYVIVRKYLPLGDISVMKRLDLSLDSQGFKVIKSEPPPKYFTMTSDVPMSITPRYDQPGGELKYSVDNGASWTLIADNAPTKAARVTMFRGNMPNNSLFVQYAGPQPHRWMFESGVNVKVKGNITTLLREDGKTNTGGNFAFSQMLCYSKNIVSAEELTIPVVMLNFAGYMLFSGCSSMVKPPKIITEQVGEYGFAEMFYNCTKLAYFPELPATTLSPYCYFRMFNECISFTGYAPVLPSYPYVQPHCYQEMFNGCKNLGAVHPMDFGNVECAVFMFSGIPDLFSYNRGEIHQVRVSTSVNQEFFSDAGGLYSYQYGKG